MKRRYAFECATLEDLRQAMTDGMPFSPNGKDVRDVKDELRVMYRDAQLELHDIKRRVAAWKRDIRTFIAIEEFRVLPGIAWACDLTQKEG